MAIVQDVLLKFNADTSDISKNAVDLAARFQQSQIPAGEAGALDMKERAALEEEIKERAAASGLTQKEVKATLMEMNKIAQEIADLEEQNNQIKKEQLELDKAGAEQLAKKAEKLREAASLAGLAENATHEEIVARRDELALLAKKGQLTKKEQAELKQINHLLRSAGGHQGEYTKLIGKNVDLTEKVKTNTEKIDSAVNRYSTKARTVVKTKVEEEEAIMLRLAGLQVKSGTALGKAAKSAAKAKEALAKATQETVAMEKASARAKDNFATKAISALAYYEALTLLKRAARAAAQTLKELDQALTDIAVVTTMTREES